ncbi:MAG: aromatic ring-hydroxylating dioxygenase subunit alpha [Pseudomonadales bacterium]|nr:aromatic ring-hydroxylating dioxygenase subunit alpha [Pseudomonadales bacterium]MCP5182525.1 aromatic ring-hydroxylating dioxygenase subunit alpha [Pseudomonadales bacterium]
MGSLEPISNAHGREIFYELARRLHANVARNLPDQADAVLTLPATNYLDAAQFEREIERIFLKVPLLVALDCDIPNAGDFLSYAIVGRPLLIVRGDDGVARTFLNVCRHRGAALTTAPCGNARAFVCPYHSWTYDRQGALKGVPDEAAFGAHGVEGLLPLPTDTVAGAIFASLDPAAHFSAADWLGETLVRSLEALRLKEMHAYRRTSTLASPNWKLAADGYLDGYHIGFLHRNTIGTKGINNRNTYDLLGPHVRIGFANKGINQVDELPEDQWNLGDVMSLVHYIFPNVSISGGHKDTIQLSRLFPGPGVTESTTVQHQYFYEPVEGEMAKVAEAKRITYEQVVRDEDCSTIFTINEALPAMTQVPFLFGRNEPGNQSLHRTIAAMTAG